MDMQNVNQRYYRSMQYKPDDEAEEDDKTYYWVLNIIKLNFIIVIMLLKLALLVCALFVARVACDNPNDSYDL